MVELNVKKRMYAYVIMMIIFLTGLRIASKLIDNLYTNLWIMIPLLIAVMIIGWKIARPIGKELKKGGETKQKVEDSFYSGGIKILTIGSYIIGILYTISGLFFLVMAFLYYLKFYSRFDFLLIVRIGSDMFLAGGIGIILLIMGVIAIFAGKGLSKGKKWGRTLLTVDLIFHILLFLLLVFFGISSGKIGGIVFGLLGVLTFSFIIYLLHSKWTPGYDPNKLS